MEKIVKRFGHRYPWKKWFSSPSFSLAKGTDFEGLPHGMAGMVRNAAARLGFSVSLRVGEDRIDVEVSSKKAQGA